MYSVNRLQSSSHENSHRGPTRGLIELKFGKHIRGQMGYVLAISNFLLIAHRSNKNCVNSSLRTCPDFRAVPYNKTLFSGRVTPLILFPGNEKNHAERRANGSRS